jgi:hypothetical protein
VKCAEASLGTLAQDLADIDNQEPNQRSKAEVMFLRIPLGERVGNMNDGDRKHIRYEGTVWIADKFERKGLADSIKDVLQGARDSLGIQ